VQNEIDMRIIKVGGGPYQLVAGYVYIPFDGFEITKDGNVTLSYFGNLTSVLPDRLVQLKFIELVSAIEIQTTNKGNASEKIKNW